MKELLKQTKINRIKREMEYHIRKYADGVISFRSLGKPYQLIITDYEEMVMSNNLTDYLPKTYEEGYHYECGYDYNPLIELVKSGEIFEIYGDSFGI